MLLRAWPHWSCLRYRQHQWFWPVESGRRGLTQIFLKIFSGRTMTCIRTGMENLCSAAGLPTP